MLKEDFVSFEQAKLLAEKGFPQDVTSTVHYINGSYYDENESTYKNILLPMVSLSLVQKWIREEKKIWIEVTLCSDYHYQVYLKTLKNKDHNIISSVSRHKTPDEALSAGIDKVLKDLI